MKFNIWFSVTTKIVILISFLVGMINYIVDPLWFFNHSNKFNRFQNSFNDRQLKMNNIYFNGLDQYDSIMVGSSRTTFINQHKFKTMNVYNLAAPDMIPFEYESYIEVAKKIKGKEFKYIIIGLDFFGTNSKIYDSLRKKNHDAWFYYNKINNDIFYMIKHIFSVEVLKKSFQNISNTKQSKIYYTRDLVKCNKQVSNKEKQHLITQKLQKLKKRTYLYDRPSYMNILQTIKKNNPHSQFIIFITPITKRFFDFKMYEKGWITDYKIWLRDVKSIFPHAINFMDDENFINNYDNFIDAHHIFYKRSTYIIKRLEAHNE